MSPTIVLTVVIPTPFFMFIGAVNVVKLRLANITIRQFRIGDVVGRSIVLVATMNAITVVSSTALGRDGLDAIIHLSPLAKRPILEV